ncbi:MAG TPA: protein-L-isoaspartate O-methyltransferase [Rectinemataceae bacterium]|nr:protein-L-isoaspartate O-methyltransferase [Rectinemataceae bacterium]
MSRGDATNEGLIRTVGERLAAGYGDGYGDGYGIEAGTIARVLAAMRVVDRADFLPPSQRGRAYQDGPLPIGMDQTCSQPSTVAMMLGSLDPRPGQRLLEIGSGSGYAAAIAAILVAPEGRVFACELLPELLARARSNCAAIEGRSWSRATTMTFIEGDGSAGFPDLGPFDRILVSAGVKGSGFDEGLLASQLAEGGILVYPEAFGRMHRVERRGGEYRRDSWGYVAFVPLKGRNSGLPLDDRGN